jgi:hypothetical protein
VNKAPGKEITCRFLSPGLDRSWQTRSSLPFLRAVEDYVPVVQATGGAMLLPSVAKEPAW